MAVKRLSYRIQVLDRTFAILDVLMDSGKEVGIADLTAKLKLSKSTVHRILMNLETNRYVERIGADGRYRLGPRLFELGTKALATLDLRDEVQPCLERLVARTGETSHFGVFRDGEVTSLFNVQTKRSLGSASTVGRRVPVYCTSLGKAILAFRSKDEVEEVVRRCRFSANTQHTITDPMSLLAELNRIRKRGYAIDDEEFEIGLRCIGAPVKNHLGEVIGAISIAGPAVRVSKRRVPELARHVVEVAEELSTRLGNRGKV
ncbi:MAG TPA: IclR family transcriptional regulator [Terriglobia bacterium]|nr:IclR family transcriptional regulator [Terriglobia bacterium]